MLRRQSVLFAWFGVSLFGGPVFVGIISFAAYAGAGNTFTVAQVYQAVALFSMLRFPLSFLPQFLAQVTAALVSLTAVTTTVTSAATPAALVALTTAVTTTVTPARAPVSSLPPLKRRCRGRSASAGCA